MDLCPGWLRKGHSTALRRAFSSKRKPRVESLKVFKLKEKIIVRQLLETDLLTYIHKLPASASFTGKGFLGYTFGPLHNKDVEIFI